MSNICTLEQAEAPAARLKELCRGVVDVYLYGDVALHGHGEELSFILEVSPCQYERFREVCQLYNEWLRAAREKKARENQQEEIHWEEIHWFARKVNGINDYYYYPCCLPRTLRAKKALSIFELMEFHLKEIAAAGRVLYEMISVICLPVGWNKDPDLQDKLQKEIPRDSDFDPESFNYLMQSAKRFPWH